MPKKAGDAAGQLNAGLSSQQAFARDQKTVPRTWDPLTGEPHEIVGKLERMGWQRQARSRYGRKKAMMQMYTARPTRTFDYTVPGRRFNETR